MKRHRSIPENISLKRTFTIRPKKTKLQQKAFNTCTGKEMHIERKKISQICPQQSAQFGLAHLFQAKFCKESQKMH